MDGIALESGVCLRFDLSQRHVRKSDLSWNVGFGVTKIVTCGRWAAHVFCHERALNGVS